MCLNCGCGMVDDDMGNKDNVTLTSLAKAAVASGMDGKDTLENMKSSVSSIKPEELDKKIQGLKDK